MDIRKLVESEREFLVSTRRHFHENPELSQKEFQTMDYIEGLLHEWNIETVRVPHGGIFGFLDSGRPGCTVLMRADIDALPIEEDKNNLAGPRAVISKNRGVMHACGHDGHMAMLLTEAKILAAHRNEWQGKVVLMFEEAEEMGERGIAHLLRYLRDHDIHIDSCFGTHVQPGIPAGHMAVIDGATMAGAFFYEVKIHGHGGHGSRPDLTVSPIECFLSFANELRAYRMRAVSPDHVLAYSFGSVNAGDTPNVIPDELKFAGTARTLNNEDGLAFRKDFWKILHAVADIHHCEVEVLFDQYFPVTANNHTAVEIARRTISDKVGPDVVDVNQKPNMATETFSITESTYPGVFFFTGVGNKEKGAGTNLHTSKFDIDEEGLVTGAECALAYVTTILSENPVFSDFKKEDLESMLKLTE